MKYSYYSSRAVALVKCLAASYVITGLLLLAIAAALYKISISEQTVSIGIIAVYCISSLAAGFLYAKGVSHRRFLWGLCAGVAYFVIVCAVSAVMNREFSPSAISCITTFFICAGSGMLGGMIA